LKKNYLLTALLIIFLSAAPAAAHEVWALAVDPEVGSPATVVFGYGHVYPGRDTLEAADFDSRFNPPKLTGPAGDVPVERGKDAMTYLSSEPLSAGTYTVSAESKPGFGSRTPDGYKRGSKTEFPDATACTYSHRYGKEVISLEGQASGFDKPLGHALEIVPQADPTAVKVRQALPVKVLFDGKPRRGVQLTAFFVGFTPDNSASAFAASTGKEGSVDFIPLAPGSWLLKAEMEGDYSDKAVCDRESWEATLIFDVSE
jgi:uncharacterized GH25 family protein